MTRIYVAGASAEADRASRWIAALESAGITVTFDWPKHIKSVGDANPAHASPAQRAAWAEEAIYAVGQADMFWLLAPSPGIATAGAYVELGYWHAQTYLHSALADQTYVSGSTTTVSIFHALGREYTMDEDAFQAIMLRVDPRWKALR